MPLVAMQFTEEVDWKLSDFIVAAILLFGTGLLLELILRKTKRKKIRIVLAAVLVILFILFWAELAVGVFGTPLSGH